MKLLQMPKMFCCVTAACKKMVLANKMKSMREELRKINEQARSFNFTVSVGANLEQQHYNRRETAAAVDETTHILGRDGEKKEIIDILSASLRKDGTMVLPIYGLGGMGKTTLVQVVYNDTQFKQYECQTWVYVSQELDLKKIGRSIISQISPDASQHNLDELHMIRHCLDNLLPSKKILIVLDDLWRGQCLPVE
jgi:ATPase subunit of ABC transporter with duplicated ATPase domains